MMLAKLLKEKCQKLELSSRQTAEKVGVSHATILRALRGDTVDLDTLIKLSNWLNVKPSTLLNSFVSSTDTLADRIAVIIERHPKLGNVFSRALKATVDRDIPLEVIDDIAMYAAYKLDNYLKQSSTQ